MKFEIGILNINSMQFYDENRWPQLGISLRLDSQNGL